MALLCHKLSALYDSGVPLNRALRAIEESVGNFPVKYVAGQLRGAIERGATLGQAVEFHKGRFSPVFVTLINIGERTGTLGDVFPQLARYYDDLRNMYHAVIRQIAYPVAVLGCILVGIPMLTAFLSDVAGIAEAPFAEQLYWIVRNFLWKAAGVYVGFIVLARITFHFTTRESILMYAWPIAGLVRTILLSRFAWAMMVFTRTGMSLHRAIPLAGQLTGANRIAKDFARVAPLLQEGFTLEQALAQTKFFPKKAMVYVQTGEVTGYLDRCFEQLSRGLYESAVFRLRILIGLIEPLAILILGGLVVMRLS